MNNLPKELIAIILYNLEFKDLFLNVNLTCKKFHELINKIWFRIKYMSQYQYTLYYYKYGERSNDMINYITINDIIHKINMWKYYMPGHKVTTKYYNKFSVGCYTPCLEISKNNKLIKFHYTNYGLDRGYYDLKLLKKYINLLKIE